jgi:hypothetical protein
VQARMFPMVSIQHTGWYILCKTIDVVTGKSIDEGEKSIQRYPNKSTLSREGKVESKMTNKSDNMRMDD